MVRQQRLHLRNPVAARREDEADHPAASVSPLLKSALVGLSAGMNVNSANISRRAAGGLDAEMGGES